jgi:exopolysaccharide biosynthesis predicted pyruvyltransferase EpsI
VADLRAALHAAIASAIPKGEPVALLDFPSYPNVGDSAIWLGTVAVLRDLGCPVVYVADQLSYSPQALERRLPPGAPVLLQGGGSFGDLWPEHQLFRERVVRELPERPIVQLPVSVDFRTATAEDRARTTLDAHEHLTLLCRDRESLAYAEANYRAPSRLCPDAAFGLDPAPRDPPVADVVVLRRTDHEGLRGLPPVPGARVLDWSSAPGEPGYSPWWERKRLATRAMTKAMGMGRVERIRQAAMSRLFDSMAGERVEFGYSVVSSGRVLVTDRLHGHILALLLEVPHVVVDTGYGKIRRFNESFSGRMDGVAYCDDDDCVESEVRRLLARR